uniref:Antitoxin ParD1/3/4 n=1 Tax=Candidatus Kentrum sp. DK TaxID=2126562 RepID=A0A450TLX0_9GAMM|nr:MAG: antitoxin ParD1/3/4 [Candidatus Kentron sp. DK]
MDATPETRLSVRLKGPLAAHVDRQIETALYESHSEYIRDLVRRDMLSADEYDVRQGIIEGYADIASGRFTDSLSHEQIFQRAVEELREEGYPIREEE